MNGLVRDHGDIVFICFPLPHFKLIWDGSLFGEGDRYDVYGALPVFSYFIPSHHQIISVIDASLDGMGRRIGKGAPDDAPFSQGAVDEDGQADLMPATGGEVVF